MHKKLMVILVAGILLLSIGSAACAVEEEQIPAETVTEGIETTATEGLETTVPEETTAPTVGENDGFNDVTEDAYYFEAVNWAVEQVITQGMGDGLFMPDATCTRAQVVTFLWRLDGKHAPASVENTFADVEAGSWYGDAVLWAVEQKVTDGMGDGIFLPDGTCTRAQIVTFLWKYAGKSAVAEGAENPFDDVDADAWYMDAVLWAVEKGITTGLTETAFGPEESCTRAQIVTFLYRYAHSEVEGPSIIEPTETQPVETEPYASEPENGEEDWSGGMTPILPEPDETQPSATVPEDTQPEEDNWGGGVAPI